MGSEDDTPKATSASDLRFNAELAFRCLHLLREKRGLTQRALGALGNIAHSEVQRVESGQQECRLSSFIAICGELGVPPGWVLDLMIRSNPALFFQRLEGDPGFTNLMESLGITVKREREDLALHLASACELAAVLLRLSAPRRRAQFQHYPTDEWRSCFLEFARRVESFAESFDRMATLVALRNKPVATLKRFGLLPRASLEQKRDDLRLPKSERKSLSFGGDLYSLKFEESWGLLGIARTPGTNELTDAETRGRAGSVKLPGLLVRLKKATEPAGKKTELAKFLSEQLATKVPLASVSRWLSGEREPGGEVALQLDAWASAQGYPKGR
jgi:transcriptional regulator with XRE-family HTH domain